jgi:chorismate mutase
MGTFGTEEQGARERRGNERREKGPRFVAHTKVQPNREGIMSELDADAELRSLRNSIDNIDAALIHLLAERFKCTQQVGHLKAANDMPPADLEREGNQIARLRALAVDSRLDPAFGEKFLNFIVAEVIHQHEQIASTGAVTVVTDPADDEPDDDA